MPWSSSNRTSEPCTCRERRPCRRPSRSSLRPPAEAFPPVALILTHSGRPDESPLSIVVADDYDEGRLLRLARPIRYEDGSFSFNENIVDDVPVEFVDRTARCTPEGS